MSHSPTLARGRWCCGNWLGELHEGTYLLMCEVKFNSVKMTNYLVSGIKSLCSTAQEKMRGPAWADSVFTALKKKRVTHIPPYTL